MEKKLSIEITASRPVSITLLEADGPSTGLAIVFPGASYSCDRPLLYYISEILRQRKLNIALVNINLADDPYWVQLPVEKRFASAHEQFTKAFEEIVKTLGPEDIYLVAKSVSTGAALKIALEKPSAPIKKILLLTPALEGDWSRLGQLKEEALIVMGTADPIYELRKSELPDNIFLIEGADHALEGKDWRASLGMLGKILLRVEQWIDT